MNRTSLALFMIFLLLFLAVGYLALGSVRDVQCEAMDASNFTTNISSTVTIRFLCENSGWVPLANVSAEVRIAEKGQEIGGGWYTAGNLVAARQISLGTLEPGIPVVKKVRFRGLNWSRDVGIGVRPFQV